MADYANIVVSSRVRLARNFSDIPFPSRLAGGSNEANKVIDTVKSTCDKLFKYDLYRMNKLSQVDRIALLERHLISTNLVENVDNGAVIIDKNNLVSVMLNEEDHVRAQCVVKGYALEKSYEIIREFDRALAQNASIAFNQKLGYLTSCPTNLGTGMRASVMLFLPALTHSGEINAVIRAVQQMGLTVRGSYGEGSEANGYLYQVSNQVSIGMTEEDIIKAVTNTVEKICEAEERARKKWYKAEGIMLEDKIMRSFGILLYARSISSSEFMEHMANVKLGVALKVLDLDMAMLNTLTELCQPANLCHYGGRSMDVNERDQIRANLVREKIQVR